MMSYLIILNYLNNTKYFFIQAITIMSVKKIYIAWIFINNKLYNVDFLELGKSCL